MLNITVYIPSCNIKKHKVTKTQSYHYKLNIETVHENKIYTYCFQIDYYIIYYTVYSILLCDKSKTTIETLMYCSLISLDTRLDQC